MTQSIEQRIPSEISICTPPCEELDPVAPRRTFLRARPDYHVRHSVDDVLVQPMPEGTVMDPVQFASSPDAVQVIHAPGRDDVGRQRVAIIRDGKD